ncbi:MAG: universal stress protein [Roseivirga sp.]
MKKILVPTDFSDCATKAGKVAMHLARTKNAELHFLHIIDIPADWITIVSKAETTLYADITKKVNDHQQQLSQLVAEAQQAGLNAQKHLLYNQDYKGILSYARDREVDMIVMGSHGASGFREWLIGSNAQRVVRNAEVPVLVVKGEETGVQLDRLLLHNDFEIDELESFVPVVNIAKDLEAKIDLLLVCTPNDFYPSPEAEARLNLYKSAAPQLVEGTHLYNAQTEEEGLIEWCKRENPGLLTMLYNKKKTKNRYVRRHVEELINHLEVSFLSIPVD